MRKANIDGGLRDDGCCEDLYSTIEDSGTSRMGDNHKHSQTFHEVEKAIGSIQLFNIKTVYKYAVSVNESQQSNRNR